VRFCESIGSSLVGNFGAISSQPQTSLLAYSSVNGGVVATTARRRRRKPRYTVDVELQAQDIARLGAALTFRVKQGEAMLGTIQIGQGGFRWKGRSGKFFRRTSWSRFFERMERA